MDRRTDGSLAVDLARDQLSRMRGMTALYHRRFFADVRFVLVVVLLLYGAGFVWDRMLLLLIPFVVVWGAVQTAFDASYLIFSRHYAAALEAWLNRRAGEKVLVGADLEASYLFPLDDQKVVTVPVRGPWSWFATITVFTTMGGLGAGVAALWLGFPLLDAQPAPIQLAYWLFLLTLTGGALGTGWWWFVTGVGEQRLRQALAPLRNSPD